MKANGLARLGGNAEIRYLPNGDPVVGMSLAFTYGKKGEDGHRQTQWVKASWFGKRAEKLVPYLLKGKQIVAHLNDVRIETFEGRNGPVTSLVATVDDVELVADGNRDAGAASAPRPSPTSAPQRQAPAPQHGGSGFDDMDEDIPFVTAATTYDMTTRKQRKMDRYDY